MLKKLFKYEWHDVWKPLGIFNLVVILLSLLSYFTFSPQFMDLVENNEYAAMIMVLYNLLYFAAIMALGFATSFFMFARFYKNLYTDEGYLMHTLPVTTHELIWSKAFVAIIWSVIGFVVMAFSFLMYFNSIMISQGGENVWQAMRELFAELSQAEFPEGTGLMMVLIVLIMLVAPVYSILFGYTAISLGQLTKKHKILAAVGIYFGINYGIQIVSSLATVPFMEFVDKAEAMSDSAVMSSVNGGMAFSLIFTVGLACLFYFITNKIMKTKLNLE